MPKVLVITVPLPHLYTYVQRSTAALLACFRISHKAYSQERTISEKPHLHFFEALLIFFFAKESLAFVAVAYGVDCYDTFCRP